MINCKGCTACCGPVPVTIKEMNEIQKELSKKSKKEINRLSKQKRDPLTCMFVDTKNKRCSIYNARPNLCRNFGYAKGLECPYNPEYATKKYEGELHIPIGVLGTTITWENIFHYSR